MKLKTELAQRRNGRQGRLEIDRPSRRTKGGRARKSSRTRFDEPGVMVIAFPSAKGLEFDTVFLPRSRISGATRPDRSSESRCM